MNAVSSCAFIPWSRGQVVELISGITGWRTNIYELLKVGDRIVTMARLFNMREGLTRADDVLRGVLVNGLSPHPWLFWIGVGAPVLVTAWRAAPGRAVAYLVGFYLTILGAKIAIAAVVAAGRQRLSTEWRYRLLVGGGGLLIVFGVLLAIRA